jgi:hypothetical protein
LLRSGLALHLAWCCLVVGVLLHASPARADAPMCDRVGASVDAPPDIPPARSGSVEELPCRGEQMSSLLDEAVRPLRHHAFKELDTHHPRVWALVHTIVLLAPSQPAVARSPERLAPLRGHPRPVYRPPLAA